MQLLPLSRATEHLALGTHEYVVEAWNCWSAAGAKSWEFSDMMMSWVYLRTPRLSVLYTLHHFTLVDRLSQLMGHNMSQQTEWYNLLLNCYN